MQNATKYGNTTLDHVMHLLLVSGAWPGGPACLHRARRTVDIQYSLTR